MIPRRWPRSARRRQRDLCKVLHKSRAGEGYGPITDSEVVTLSKLRIRRSGTFEPALTKSSVPEKFALVQSASPVLGPTVTAEITLS